MRTSVLGQGTETYLYLNGIKPREEICLGEGVTLLPASCDPTPSNIVSKAKSELDIGVSCLFLRSVSACLHIVANTPKELATKTWNSQWDAILLSALYDCEIGFNFQSDLPPENFNESTMFHITNYHLKGFTSGQDKILTKAEHVWLQNNFQSAQELLEDERYNNAIHCLASYRWHAIQRAQLALIWAGIEGFFNVDYELSFRLSLYIAKYFAPKTVLNKKKFLIK